MHRIVNFDPEVNMVCQEFKNPGYHSRTPTGTVVHDTRASLAYAHELLLEPAPGNIGRALAILRQVVPLQDTDPVSKTYGIWSWHLEEPLDQMDPPDWNWADFCGLTLSKIWLDARDHLPEEMRQAIRQAIHHCAGSIYRRNMGPHYTNISIMGGIVTTIAGELLEEPRMVEYGERRLRQAVEYYQAQGGFNEYNSPTYTRVVMLDCEDGLRYVQSPAAAECIRFLHEKTWETVAHHYHPATGQWSGPHSRDYHVFMRVEMGHYLETRAGVAYRRHPLAEIKETTAVDHPTRSAQPCPERLLERFQALPEPEYQLREQFGLRRGVPVIGTTWFSDAACLSTVNYDHFWDQRRLLLGFWNGAAKSAVALRLRFMHDGHEFCSAFAWQVQEGRDVLCAMQLLLGRGDMHPEWGNPPEDCFTAEDFRIRVELYGLEVEAAELEPGLFSLRSGEWHALVRPADCRFGGEPVSWEITRGENWVALDGVCYSGAARAFPFRDMHPTILGLGLRLAPAATTDCPAITARHFPDEGVTQFEYAGMAQSAPDRAHPVP